MGVVKEKMHESERDKQFKNEDFAPTTDNVGNTSLADVLDVQMAQLVVLQRIYDVQMAILSSKNETLADSLYDFHEQGGLAGPDVSWNPDVTWE